MVNAKGLVVKKQTTKLKLKTIKNIIMKKLNEFQEWQLIVESRSGNRFGYYGQTKKECIMKAKNAFRYNGYKKEWHIMEIED